MRADESHIWKRFKKGDEQAFSQIFKTYYNELYNYGIRFTRDGTMTEDSLQEFFLYLWKHKENLRDLDTPRFYLFKSYRRHLFQALKKAQNTKDIYDLPDQESYEEWTYHFNIDEGEMQAEKTRRLNEMIAKLPSRQKEILHLRYYQGLSCEEIAQVTQLSYRTVLNHLQAAYKNLRRVKFWVIISIFTCLLTIL